MSVWTDGTVPETCAECGFDATVWRVRDAVTFFAALGRWWALAVDGLPAGALNARPAPGVWSALEYGLHSALVTAVVRDGVARVVTEDGVRLPAPAVSPAAGADDDPLVLDAAAVVADLEREGQALSRLARQAPDGAWAHVGLMPEGRVQALAALRHAVHDASHHQMDVGRGLATLGTGAPRQEGRVVRINAGDGGVPKAEVAAATVDHGGLVGDRQADTKHHGRPFQALSLWSAEVIGDLALAGHPIGAGSAGENLTVSGVDWTTIRPGTRVRIGTALAEVSFPATPCAKQTRWFSDGDFGRIDHDRNPDLTRWYAWVREPGEVRTGDPVVVQP